MGLLMERSTARTALPRHRRGHSGRRRRLLLAAVGNPSRTCSTSTAAATHPRRSGAYRARLHHVAGLTAPVAQVFPCAHAFSEVFSVVPVQGDAGPHVPPDLVDTRPVGDLERFRSLPVVE